MTIPALACCLGLVACAGDDTDGKDEADIRTIIREASTSTDPGLCTTHQTQALLEQDSATKGRAAVTSCREGAAGDAADSVDISSVDVTGDTTANASLRLHGGGANELEDQQLEFRLRKEGERWKIDRLTDIDLDRAKFDRGLRREFTMPPNRIPAPVAECFIEQLGPLSDAKLEAGLLKPDPSFIAEPLLRCFLPATLRREGVPAAVIRCTVRRMRERFEPAELVRLVLAGGEALGQMLARELAACTGRAPQQNTA